MCPMPRPNSSSVAPGVHDKGGSLGGPMGSLPDVCQMDGVRWSTQNTYESGMCSRRVVSYLNYRQRIKVISKSGGVQSSGCVRTRAFYQSLTAASICVGLLGWSTRSHGLDHIVITHMHQAVAMQMLIPAEPCCYLHKAGTIPKLKNEAISNIELWSPAGFRGPEQSARAWPPR